MIEEALGRRDEETVRQNNMRMKESVDGLREVLDQLTAIAGEKTGDENQAGGGLEDEVHGMKENLSRMEKVVAAGSSVPWIIFSLQ